MICGVVRPVSPLLATAPSCFCARGPPQPPAHQPTALRERAEARGARRQAVDGEPKPLLRNGVLAGPLPRGIAVPTTVRPLPSSWLPQERG